MSQIFIKRWCITLSEALDWLAAIPNHPAPEADNRVVQSIDCFQIQPWSPLPPASAPTAKMVEKILVTAFITVEPPAKEHQP